MRIAILSDSPTLATGFARTTRTLCLSLQSAGHEVMCFGIGIFGDLIARAAYPYRIWPAGLTSDDLHAHFATFYNSCRPDFIVINYDLLTTLSWLRAFQAMGLGEKTICHLVVDGLPITDRLLDPLSSCRGLVVPSARVAEYLLQHTKCPVRYFPHLVNLTAFSPKHVSRSTTTPLIGCVAQNRPRKQLQQILQAIIQLNTNGFSCSLRLHTDRINALRHGGDNLLSIIQTMQPYSSSIIVTEYGDCYDISGSPQYSDEAIADIIRSCDCMIVAPTCGGFEYGIIEAQACGVPVLVTADEGVLEEVAGGGARLLTPALTEVASYGARISRIAAGTIAESIKTVLLDEQLQRNIISAGRINASRYDLKTRYSDFALILNEFVGDN